MKIWFLRNGNHLCKGFVGRATDEYSNDTWWLNVGFGVFVLIPGYVRRCICNTDECYEKCEACIELDPYDMCPEGYGRDDG